MPAQKGSDLLLRVGDGGSPPVYTTIAGLRTKAIAFNGEVVDITNSDDQNKWRRLLAGAGIKSMSLTAAGVHTGAATDTTLRDLFMNGNLRDMQIVMPGFTTVEGLFQVSALEWSGEHNAEVTFSVTLESAGTVYLTP